MKDMWDAVVKEYKVNEVGLGTMWDQAHLLWIRRHDDEDVTNFIEENVV